MDRQGERVAHADVPHPARTDRGVDHRQPKRAARLMERAAPWIATRLDRNRLLGDRALVAGAACWVLAVFALYGVLVWFFSTPFVAHYLLALIAILAVPLARISAAPLALAWNRHR